MTANRALHVGIEVLEGADILAQGHEQAQRLWNQTWHCAVGYNSYLRRVRGDAKVTHSSPYLGKFGMEAALRDYEAYHNLAGRCAEYTIADFDIAMRSWFSNLKHNPLARPPRKSKSPRTLTFEVGRNAKHLLDKTFRLTVLGGHIEQRHCIVKLCLEDGTSAGQIKLLRIKPNGQGAICFYRAPGSAIGDHIAAIDIGVVNLMTAIFDDGDSIMYSGKGLLDAYRYGQARAAKCKPSGWRGKGEQNSRYSQRTRAYKRDATETRALALHNMTTHFMAECQRRGVSIVVVGDLRNCQGLNQTLTSWLRGELVRQLQYKGEDHGIAIKRISEAYTSITCAACGERAERDPRGLLTCSHCGHIWNSDLNGAVNILNKYLLAGRLGVGATLPGPPSLAVPAPGTGKAFTQMHPVHVARCDFRTDCHVTLQNTGYSKVLFA